MHRILLVCLGNICRSPAAHGVMQAKAEARGMSVTLDSAGTGGWHEGASPDRRMIAAAAGRGYDLRALRARKVVFDDFYEFDYILAMDRSNYADLIEMAPHNQQATIAMFLDYAGLPGADVPDPYYGGPEGFTNVLDLVEKATDGFLDYLTTK